jgi:hypothetical protein
LVGATTMAFVSNTVEHFLSMNNHEHGQAWSAIDQRVISYDAFMIIQPR